MGDSHYPSRRFFISTPFGRPTGSAIIAERAQLGADRLNASPVWEALPKVDMDALRDLALAALARDDAVHAALDNENVEAFAKEVAATTARFHEALDGLSPAFRASLEGP